MKETPESMQKPKPEKESPLAMFSSMDKFWESFSTILKTFFADLKTAFLPNEKTPGYIMGIIIFSMVLSVLLVWEHLLPKDVPRSGKVWEGFVKLYFEEGLGREFLKSLWLMLESLLYAVVISFSLAYLTRVSFFKPIAAFISKWRFLGIVGLPYFLTIAAGGGHPLKVAIMLVAMIGFFTVSMLDVVNSVPRAQYDLARSMRMSEWRGIWEVVIRGTRGQAWDVIRANAAISSAMLTSVEYRVRSGGGIGAMLGEKDKYFVLEDVMAIQLFYLLFGLLVVDFGLWYLKKKTSKYAFAKLEG